MYVFIASKMYVFIQGKIEQNFRQYIQYVYNHCNFIFFGTTYYYMISTVFASLLVLLHETFFFTRGH